jgi:hypothetical protein
VSLTLDQQRSAVAGRSGKYADAYRFGLIARAGEIDPAIDAKALGQGYRDGLKGAPYRVGKKGKGSAAKTAQYMREYRARKKANAAFPSPASNTQP